MGWNIWNEYPGDNLAYGPLLFSFCLFAGDADTQATKRRKYHNITEMRPVDKWVDNANTVILYYGG